MRWDHADKHKSRWSVRSLPEVLCRAGLEPHAVRFYSVTGELHLSAGGAAGWISRATERELVSRIDYLLRPESLIVDGFSPDPDKIRMQSNTTGSDLRACDNSQADSLGGANRAETCNWGMNSIACRVPPSTFRSSPTEPH